MKAVGKDPKKDAAIIGFDGGCDAIKRGVKTGVIDAIAMQYPQKMAAQGVKAIAEAVRAGKKPTGYVDTGVSVITAEPVDGVASKDVAFGLDNCFG